MILLLLLLLSRHKIVLILLLLKPLTSRMSHILSLPILNLIITIILFNFRLNLLLHNLRSLSLKFPGPTGPTLFYPRRIRLVLYTNRRIRFLQFLHRNLQKILLNRVNIIIIILTKIIAIFRILRSCCSIIARLVKIKLGLFRLNFVITIYISQIRLRILPYRRKSILFYTIFCLYRIIIFYRS